MAETGSMVENLRDGARGFFHPQSPKEAYFPKVQPAPTPKMLVRKAEEGVAAGLPRHFWVAWVRVMAT